MSETGIFRGGPMDGSVLTSEGAELPSVLRYPVARDNSVIEHTYTLRGTRATGYWFDYLGVQNV